MRHRHACTHLRFAALVIGITAVLVAACGGRGSGPATAPTASSTSTATSSTAQPDFVAQASDFRNLHTMTHVRGFFVTNLAGHLAQAVAIARADRGGVYPVGTVIQLVPQEAMVKRHAGWNPSTHDWEFFSLAVSKSGTKILSRGATNVVNRFGGSCDACHAAAAPKWDEVCEHDHGCAPLPISDAVIGAIQQADPRSS